MALLETSCVLEVRVEESIDKILHFICGTNPHCGSKLSISILLMGKNFVSDGHFWKCFVIFRLNQERYKYKLFVPGRVYT